MSCASGCVVDGRPMVVLVMHEGGILEEIQALVLCTIDTIVGWSPVGAQG